MIRRVLVYTYGDHSHDHTIEAAASFAKQHSAKLIGLFVRPDIMAFSGVYGAYPVDLSQSLQALQNEYAANNKSTFEKISAKHKCRCQWHEVSEYEDQPQPALYVDYIFVSQPKKAGQAVFNESHFVNQLLTDTGLPLAIIPENWTADSFAKTPLFGWKESREAMAAFHHTANLMRNANKVDVVNVVKKEHSDTEFVNGIEICDYLAEHEVSCEYFSQPMLETERHEFEGLIRHLKENANDAIIIGAYSHSRIREVIFGGMTRDLIRNSPVPLLLAH